MRPGTRTEVMFIGGRVGEGKSTAAADVSRLPAGRDVTGAFCGRAPDETGQKTSLTERVAECVLVLRDALDEPDPWTALKTVVGWFAELQISDPGLLRTLLDASAGGAPFAQARSEHAAALDLLVRRAAGTRATPRHLLGTTRPLGAKRW